MQLRVRTKEVAKVAVGEDGVEEKEEELRALNKPLELPCGLVMRNRFCKAAMTETLADSKVNLPNEGHFTLYRTWADESLLGVVITGNVMVDKRYREAPRNVVLDEATGRDPEKMKLFQRWAKEITAQSYGPGGESKGRALAVMQISHSGRQTPMSVSYNPVGASSVPLDAAAMKGLSCLFRPPRMLTDAEVEDVKQRFVTTTLLALQAGFDGVQVHSAHGYLLSQFLSPRINSERASLGSPYGGDAINRRRLLLEIVQAIRDAVAASSTKKSFVLSVKLNSSDFQTGGFDSEEAFEVLKALRELRVDFVEISGGTYEMGAMMHGGPEHQQEMRASTRAREAYFLEFAKKARKEVPGLVLMVTGGFRSRKGMARALLEDATDIIGVARPLAIDPEATKALLEGRADQLPEMEIVVAWMNNRIRPMEAGMESSWHQYRMWILAEKSKADLKAGTGWTTLVWLLTFGVVRHFVWDYGHLVKSLRRALPGVILFGLFYFTASALGFGRGRK